MELIKEYVNGSSLCLAIRADCTDDTARIILEHMQLRETRSPWPADKMRDMRQSIMIAIIDLKYRHIINNMVFNDVMHIIGDGYPLKKWQRRMLNTWWSHAWDVRLDEMRRYT